MKNMILIAGVAALAAASPSLAQPGKGKSHAGNAHAGQSHGKHGKSHGAMSHIGHVGYGIGGCPPGLAKKNNGCQPPGQARKQYNMGQRLPYGFNGYTPYAQIPYDVRSRYNLDPSGRYIYDQNYLYGVDPRTNAISQILSAILR